MTSDSSKKSGRVCILVLGMHRSGTSALTRVLNLLGCALPSDLLGANYSNPEGHWESQRAIEINDSLLSALGRAWDDIRELPVGWLQRPETATARQQVRAFVDREFSAENLSVLKEPRLCHLAPLWIEVLEEAGIDVRIIIPVRHPAEVAYSLARRDAIAIGRGHLMWLQHLLDAEAASRTRRRVLSHFHELLSDWRAQTDRFASALGVVWPSNSDEVAKQIDEFLRPNLRHSDARSEEDIGTRMPLPSLVADLYETLIGTDDAHSWQAIVGTADKVAAASALYSPGITELTQRLERSEQETAIANKVLPASIAQITLLAQATAAREDQINQFAKAIQERDSQIEDLRRSRAESDRHIVSLEQRLAEREVQLASNGVHIDQLTQQLHERAQLAASQGQRIASLTRFAAETENNIRELLASRSWRITHPLRVLVSFLSGKSAETIQASALGFDPAWRLEKYPDVAMSGLDFFEHHESASNAEGQQPLSPCSAPLEFKRPAFAKYLSEGIRRVSLPKPVVSMATHLAKAEPRQAPGVDLDFDVEFYLLQYPDIAKSGLDPYRHFIEHGKAEGRQGVRPKLTIRSGGITFDPSKETVLVVSHEASRTGAPILSLNIAQGLRNRFNVISLLLGEGPLMGAFQQESAFLAGPVTLCGSSLRAKLVIDQLLDLYPVKFAIVNSIESRVVLEPLARHAVPTVSLVHEFAAYTRPKHAFCDAVLWAGETIFSTPLTYENAVAEFPELSNTPFNIIPQGRCSLLTEETDEASRVKEDARVLHALRPLGSLDDKIVVLGVGFVQQRKGVDLFIKCAARVLQTQVGKRCRFVWIGNGYDPENDMGYSVYLADQLRRSGLEREVLIIEETSSIAAAYKAADILLISSRLDPLPNVAIDAMTHGLPVVCFEKTTGIANFLTAAGLSEYCVSPYLDTADMAAKVLALASSSAIRLEVGERVRQLASEQFDMSRYIEQLERVALLASARVAGQKDCVKDIIESDLLRPDYFVLPQYRAVPLNEMVEFIYLRSWATGIGRRKLYPGFHPGIYLELNAVDPQNDPLTDFLRAGKPDGPWCYDLITSADTALAIAPPTRIALHLHIYYADMLADILRRLGLNSVRPDLLVSVPNTQVADAIKQILETYTGKVADVQVVPNRGRDIGPFLTAFGSKLVENYDLVGHLHTKRSVALKDEAVGRNWHEFLLENLLGGKGNMADIILGRMAADSSIGIVFPDDPNVVGWGSNLPFAEALGQDLGLSDFPEHFLFPIGTMFWARMDAIQPLFGLRLAWDDYPLEPLAYDGSILHALERLFPFVVSSQGARMVLTNVMGVSR